MTVIEQATGRLGDVAELEAAVRAIPDPEIPVISLDDLGVIREFEVDDADGTVRVVMTPTYSGCPAMEAMTDAVERTIVRYGYAPRVRIALHPAWTTDWMSASGKEALRRFGIAPPGAAGAERGPVGLQLGRRVVTCPLCGSADSEVVSEFGSTACKTLRRCLACKEPYEEFKPL